MGFHPKGFRATIAFSRCAIGRQAPVLRTQSPIPEPLLDQAARIWWQQFGMRGVSRARAVAADRGAVALDADGRVLGVIGLRGSGGGFLRRPPLLARWLYRAAPATADLVIDGIVAINRREGVGQALVAEALARAIAEGRPGVRAEVRRRNRDGYAFWKAMGFAEVTQGRFGWPWSGTVVVMRRGL